MKDFGMASATDITLPCPAALPQPRALSCSRLLHFQAPVTPLPSQQVARHAMLDILTTFNVLTGATSSYRLSFLQQPEFPMLLGMLQPDAPSSVALELLYIINNLVVHYGEDATYHAFGGLESLAVIASVATLLGHVAGLVQLSIATDEHLQVTLCL